MMAYDSVRRSLARAEFCAAVTMFAVWRATLARTPANLPLETMGTHLERGIHVVELVFVLGDRLLEGFVIYCKSVLVRVFIRSVGLRHIHQIRMKELLTHLSTSALMSVDNLIQQSLCLF